VVTIVGVLLFPDPRITLICLPLYPVLRFVGRKAGWKQEGAIASLSTMLLISILVGGYAYVLLAIVFIRHIPNLQAMRNSQ